MNQNRWEFRIESEKVEGKVVEEAVKEEKKIRAEIRDVIRWGYKTQDIENQCCKFFRRAHFL